MRRADTATLVTVYIVALMIIPARLVIRGLPFSLSPADVIGLALALFWLLTQFTTTLGAAKGANPVRTALFCYVTTMVVGFGYAMSGYLPDDEVNLADHSAVLVVATAGLALAVCDGVRGYDRVNLVLKAVAVGGTGVAIVGVVQYLFRFDLTTYLALPGLRYSVDLGFVVERYSLRRVAGTTGHPIEFGVVCAMILPVALFCGFRARDSGAPALRWWICCGLVGAGLMFSVSRSAILGLATAGIVLLVGWPARRRAYAALVCLVFLAVIRIVAPGVLGGLLGLFTNLSSDSSLEYRTHDYDLAAVEIGRHLWLGRGLGTWYAPKHLVFDNQYLLSLVETGVIGLLALLAVFLISIYAAIRARYLSADPAIREAGLALAAGLMVPLVGMATFDLRSFSTVTGLTFLLCGLAGALLRTARGSAAEVSPPTAGADPPTSLPTGPAR